MKSFLAYTATAFMAVSMNFSLPAAHADETISEKVEEVGQDTKKATKRAGRKIKQKSCEMVNGKMECAVDTAKGKVKNAGDEIKDKSEDVVD